MLHLRLSGPTGEAYTFGVERLADGARLDFAPNPPAFTLGTPTDPTTALPESSIPGAYSLNIATPVAGWPDGNYAVLVVSAEGPPPIYLIATLAGGDDGPAAASSGGSGAPPSSVTTALASIEATLDSLAGVVVAQAVVSVLASPAPTPISFAVSGLSPAVNYALRPMVLTFAPTTASGSATAYPGGSQSIAQSSAVAGGVLLNFASPWGTNPPNPGDPGQVA